MEVLFPDDVAAWLDGLPKPEGSAQGACAASPHDAGVIQIVLAVRRAIALRAEAEARRPGSSRSTVSCLVHAPTLAEAGGVTSDSVLVVAGRGLGRCQHTDCTLDESGPYPVAAVAYYQGIPVASESTSQEGRIAGISVFIRVRQDESLGAHYVVIHVSPAGVRYGHCAVPVAVGIPLFLSVAEGLLSVRLWTNLAGPELEFAEAAATAFRDLALHIGGLQTLRRRRGADGHPPVSPRYF